jgi:hypothetical protein
MCSGDIGNLFPWISFCDSPFICQIFFPHSSSPIDCTVYSDDAMRDQHIRKWCRGIENCLTYIHRDDRTGLASIPGIYMKAKRMKELIPERRRITIRNSSAALELSTELHKTLSTKNWNTAKCMHAECTDICRKTKRIEFSRLSF